MWLTWKKKALLFREALNCSMYESFFEPYWSMANISLLEQMYINYAEDKLCKSRGFTWDKYGKVVGANKWTVLRQYDKLYFSMGCWLVKDEVYQDKDWIRQARRSKFIEDNYGSWVIIGMSDYLIRHRRG